MHKDSVFFVAGIWPVSGFVPSIMNFPYSGFQEEWLEYRIWRQWMSIVSIEVTKMVNFNPGTVQGHSLPHLERQLWASNRAISIAPC